MPRRSLLCALLTAACVSAPDPVAIELASSSDGHPHPVASQAPPPDRQQSASWQIGWPGAPAEPSDEAKRQNTAALELHRSGDYAGALAGFEAARESSPSYAWARYNSACALARLGRHAEAAELLRGLWIEDLPQFRQRALDDEDLAAMFVSNEGADLNAELEQITARYTEALRDGAPAFVYRPREGYLGDGQARVPYTNLRVGVYLPDSRRFVPMVPELDGAFSGLLDRTGKRALVATGSLAMKDMWEVQPERAMVSLYSLERFGDRITRSAKFAPADGVLYGFELQFAEDNTFVLTLIGVDYAEGRDFFKVEGRKMSKIGWTHQYAERIDDPPDLPADQDFLSIVDRAHAVYRPSSRVSVRGRTVTHADAPGKLRLSKGHHAGRHIIASPDPLIVIVASMTERFSDDGADGEDDLDPDARDHHVVDLVDFRAQTVTQLSEGRWIVHFAWASDGTLLLETAAATRRYPPGQLDGIADVPAGVHFGTPPFPEVGGV